MLRPIAIFAVAQIAVAALLIPNASFENSQQCVPWSSYTEGLPSGGSIHTDATTSYAGKCSMFIAANGEVQQYTEAGGIESATVAVQPGHTYAIGVLVKGSMTDNSFLKFGPVFRANGGPETWAYSVRDHINNSGWLPMTIIRTAPAGTTTMSVRIYNYNTTNTWMALWMDAVSVKDVTGNTN